ncbi:MAG: GNAT family N-acetyltransferase [Desulfobacula sp.]|jgi:acetyltransferase|uniref:bifunctional acetate--CoA ligase family protein/GNAT family N-acetyltransferase n=2 Tax=Desulfobacula sp. TaxID=2593537 RepID=UPI001D42C278|nr:GNAT family N-acetyltransferase [Desulfobacula sp.]MBT4877272.1 GNAT family N-acetyltransferase [Desulfobacula sp.]MBT5544919.1 GNAT family N-acetyltransferase [Desulfobacula sp.]MBT5971658.1 GNAT family N-acetyltransferase [Desulfobacula sp.]MBT7794270.1 GNAT family N-acetyltransferase [Desulfobacula sp.]
MGQFNLNRIFNPRYIAVVGASEKKGTIGHALMKNLIDGKFSGQLVPVNPKYQKLHGYGCIKSVSRIDSQIDLVVIATPIDTVPDIVRQCVEKKAGGAIVISAGGKEIGAKGQKIEEKIRKISYEGGLRVLGPNCMGLIRPGGGLNASFASEMPNTGNMAFVSQSGAICSSILDLAFNENIGFSHFVSIGSMLDIDFGDMIDYLGNDPKVKSILLYIESLTNFRKFMSAARSVSRIKPIIVLKSGTSAAGAKAAASHTGAMAGEDAVYDTAFKRAGIVRVNTIEELFDCAELMAKQAHPSGSRLAIITNGGGPGVMATDALAKHGHEPAVLDVDTMDELNAILPPFWSHGNPIDILGDASPDVFSNTLKACLKSKSMDGVLVILAPQALTEPLSVAQGLVDTLKSRKYPVIACWMGGKTIQKAVDHLNQAGIPTYDTPERAVRAFLYMVEYKKNLEMLLEIPPKMIRHIKVDKKKVETLFSKVQVNDFMPEADAKQVLSAYGLPVLESKTAATLSEASRIGKTMGYPLVMKLLSPDISHKTDAGGVLLDLRNDTDVCNAFDRIMSSAHQYKPDARLEGVSIQSYCLNPDFEILMGAKRDPNFGPVILFGMGGIYTEILKDRALGLPPMNRLLARRLMQETKVYQLLKGYRNRLPADMELLEEMIVRLSQLLIDFPQIGELDMNPILIKNSKNMAVDARILISKTDIPTPMHLVISPYPEEYESHLITVEGQPIFIRPVKPEDAPLFTALFKTLSPTTIYYRFFSALKELSSAMLARFTQIDYDREIALVAIDENLETSQLLGVARIIGDPDGKTGEFAVIVGDTWQGKGIGVRLLEKCLSIAQNRGYIEIHGSVLRENRNMLALGKKLGFDISRDPDTGENRLVIRLEGKN